MKGLLMAHNGTPLLMLIDDEPAQRRLIAALAARAGWRTIFANDGETAIAMLGTQDGMRLDAILLDHWIPDFDTSRSEEHTSELQSLMRISYAVFCLKKKTSNNRKKMKKQQII